MRNHARPCTCDRRVCRVCWLARYDARYRSLWGIDGPAESPPAPWEPVPREPAPVAPPCDRLGRELTGPERAAAGLTHARRWSLCLHPERPLGEYVCGCMNPVGCGPRCPGYPPARADSVPAGTPQVA